MKQKIIQIATIAGDHASDRGLYALTDAGNLYCIGADSVWIELPELPCNVPASKVYKAEVDYMQAFNEGSDHAMLHGKSSYDECLYEPGSSSERAWIDGFKSRF